MIVSFSKTLNAVIFSDGSIEYHKIQYSKCEIHWMKLVLGAIVDLMWQNRGRRTRKDVLYKKRKGWKFPALSIDIHSLFRVSPVFWSELYRCQSSVSPYKLQT
jgi:hypothetical protein